MVSDDRLLDAALERLLGSQGVPGDQLPLHVVPAAQRCGRILYMTKIDWLARLTDGLAAVPDDVALLWKYGPVGAAQGAIIRAVVQSLDAPIYFVGDLDPLDLVTYATLTQPDSALAMSYLGISDAWLERCERDRASRERTLRSVCIPMEAGEQDALAKLRRLPPPWTHPVGPRASALLEAGLKLELEGASNPDLYSRAFCDDLVRSLFS